MLDWSIDRWVSVLSAVFTVLSFLAAIGFFRIKSKTLKDLLYVEQQLDSLRKSAAKKYAALEMQAKQSNQRLSAIDPERFLDQAAELEAQGDYAALYTRAINFTEAQTDAFGKAAEIIVEEELLDAESAGESALNDAIRFATAGLAANPDNARLHGLKDEAEARLAAVKAGEPQEAIHMNGLSDVELNRLSQQLNAAGKYVLAEIAANRSVPLALQRTGEDSTNYAGAIGQHADVLRNLVRYDEAEPLYLRTLEITGKALGKDHPGYAKWQNNFAGLLKDTGRYAEAELLYRQALEITGKALGEDHPDYATGLNNLAGLLEDTGRYAEAEQLYGQALEITGKALGEDHPAYATWLNNLAGLLAATGRSAEAEPLYRQAIVILENKLGPDHPNTIQVRANLDRLLSQTTP